MWEIAVHLAVAGVVYDGVFLCCLFFPRGVLDEILDLIVSVSEGFPSYSFRSVLRDCINIWKFKDNATSKSIQMHW